MSDLVHNEGAINYILLADSIHAYIQSEHPECVVHSFTGYDIERLAVLMRENNFEKIFYLHGCKYLLAMKEYFLEREEYEFCSLIVKTIEKHNKKIKDKLPLTLAEIEVRR